MKKEYLKKIRNVYYPIEFVDWVIGTYGKEEFMPNDDTLFIWCTVFEAGKGIGYKIGVNECTP